MFAIIACLLATPLCAGELACPRSPGVPYGMGFLDPGIQARFGDRAPAGAGPFPAEPTDWPGAWRISPPGNASAPLGVMDLEEEFGAMWLRWDADLADPCSPVILLPVIRQGARLVADPETLVLARQLGLYPAPPAQGESLPPAALEAVRGLSLSRTGQTCRIAWTGPKGAQALVFQCNPFPGD